MWRFTVCVLALLAPCGLSVSITTRRTALARGIAFGGVTLAAPPALAAEPEFTTTESGLKFYDKTVPSDGAIPKPGQTVQMHYEGWLADFDDLESKFDSSYERRKPLSFAVGTGRVIAGWDEAILTAGGGMRIGTTRQIIVPPKLGYGAKGAGGIIPPDATLYFTMKLLSIAP